MAIQFDRWTLLKLFELIFTTICLIWMRITDDEASRVQLLLQKLSREWSLLNNVTWGRIGDAVADTTYGGYVIITFGLFIGRLIGELPTHKRITEFVLLGIGAILFIILGSLEFASLDSVPPALVDNAAIIGALSLLTAGLFLLDMGGPKAKKPVTSSPTPSRPVSKPLETSNITQQVYDIEKEIERKRMETSKNDQGIKNGHAGKNGVKKSEGTKGYVQMKEEVPKRFGIYGKDVLDFAEEGEDSDSQELPPKMEQHSPVWSNIRKGHYGKYDIVHPTFIYPKQRKEEERPPSGPGDPGYVQYTAQHWGEPESTPKTPRQSPTQV